jgi:hypothetical protein
MKNYPIFLVTSLLLLSCNYIPTEKEFQGSEEARAKANEMFKAIGGKSAWCSLKSLYVRAEHTEPDMTIPYTSEIWRDMDSLGLAIRQLVGARRFSTLSNLSTIRQANCLELFW